MSEELKKAVAVSEENVQQRSRRRGQLAVFLAGKCPNLGRGSISRCRRIGESFFSSVEICRKTFPAKNFGEGQKGTPGRGQDRKCHDRASLSRPLVLSLGPLTSLTSFPLFCTSEDINGRGRRGGGGASDKMGLEGKGTDLS